MRQKMVIEVSVHNTKSRTKAMTIAGGFAVALQGKDLRRIEVTGDGIDVVTLTTLLRKNVGHAELVSVSPVTVAAEGSGDGSNISEENKGPENEEYSTFTAETQFIWCPCNGDHGAPHYRYDDFDDHYGRGRDYPGCPVM